MRLIGFNLQAQHTITMALPLRRILHRLQSKPLRKDNALLVLEVYKNTHTASDLDDLLASRFFQTVLWRFFHQDVPNSHLELILQIAAYEYETYGLTDNVKLVVSDPDKLTQLILRILQSHFSHHVRTSRLEGAVFIFLRALIAFEPPALLALLLFEKWKTAVFGPYLTQLESDAKNSGASLETLQCFHSFAVACISFNVLQEDVVRLGLGSRFSDEDFGAKCNRLTAISDLFTKRKCSFTDVQVKIMDMGLADLVPLAMVSLFHDVDRPRFVAELTQCTRVDLANLATFVGFIDPDASTTILAENISRLSMPSELGFSQMCDNTRLTEIDAFDLHEKNRSLAFIPDMTVPRLDGPGTSKWLQAKASFSEIKKLHAHAVSVMERLTVTDPQKSQGVKGQSKYFSMISALRVKGSQARLELRNSQVRLSQGQMLLLLELQQPNKYDGLQRMTSWGINAARVCQILSNSDIARISWNSNGFEERFNAIIVLPESLISFDTKLTQFEVEGFKTIATSLRVDCVSENLKQENEAPKKAKTENAVISKTTIEGCSVLFSPSAKSIESDLLKVLILMLSKPFTGITSCDGIYRSVLLNAFMRNVHLNWPSQTCLVVLPTEAAVSLFDCDAGLGLMCHIADPDDRHIHRLLAKVRLQLLDVVELSKILDLLDYDFVSSISNAIMLYESHVKPLWRRFLLEPPGKREFPFGTVSGVTDEEKIEFMAKRYVEICALFETLRQYRALEKFSFTNPKDDEIEEIRKFLLHTLQFVVISEKTLPSITRQFDNVICFSSRAMKHVAQQPLRLVIFDDVLLRNTISTATVGTNHEIASLGGNQGMESSTPLPGFTNACQFIRVQSRGDQRVEEARLCVELYNYINSLGYPRESVLVVAKSGVMRLLMEEIIDERKGIQNDVQNGEESGFASGRKKPIFQSMEDLYPARILIVSCHGDPSVREYLQLTRNAIDGLFVISGESSIPLGIQPTKLEILPEESYGQSLRKSTKKVRVETSDQLRLLVQRRDTR